MNEPPAFPVEMEDEYWLISEPTASTHSVFFRIFYDNEIPDGLVFFPPLAPMDFKNK